MHSSSRSSTVAACEEASCEAARALSEVRVSRSIHARRGRFVPCTLAARLRFQGQHLFSAQVRAASGLAFLPPRKPNPAFKRTCLRHAA